MRQLVVFITTRKRWNGGEYKYHCLFIDISNSFTVSHIGEYKTQRRSN